MTMQLDTNVARVQNYTNSTLAVTLSTGGTGRIVLLHIALETQQTTPLITVASVADVAGLMWAKLAGVSNSETGQTGGGQTYQQDTEVWWAYAAAQLTSDVITVTLTANITGEGGYVDMMSIDAFSVYGQHSNTSPFDSNVALPAVNSNATSSSTRPANTGVATTQAHTMLIQFGSTDTNNAPAAAGTGWTTVQPLIAYEGANDNYLWRFSQYQTFTSAQSSFTAEFDTTTMPYWNVITYGITSDAAAPPTPITTTLKGINQNLNASTLRANTIATSLGGIAQLIRATDARTVTANPVVTTLNGIGQGVQAHIYRNAITTALQGLRQQALGYEGGGVVITTSLAGIAQLVRATESQYITIAQALRGIGQIVQALEKRNVTASLITTSLGGISQRVLTTIPAAPGQGAWWAWWSAIDDVAMISNPGMLPQSGTVWYNGVGPPSNAFGVTNDLYLDVSSGNVYLFGSNSWF